jgi:hypothetical protein
LNIEFVSLSANHALKAMLNPVRHRAIRTGNAKRRHASNRGKQ